MEGRPSACGYYLNSLVTENHIYVPVYDLAEDQLVLDLIQSHTSKKVISLMHQMFVLWAEVLGVLLGL